MKIRKCKETDILEVYNLICELKDKTLDYSNFEIAFKSKLMNDKNYYIVGIENNKIIGFLSLNIDYQLQYASKVALIEEFIVSSEYRSKGYGKELLNKAINEAKNNKCYIIELTSGFSREKAHKFYENNGFKRISYKFKIEL